MPTHDKKNRELMNQRLKPRKHLLIVALSLSQSHEHVDDIQLSVYTTDKPLTQITTVAVLDTIGTRFELRCRPVI